MKCRAIGIYFIICIGMLALPLSLRAQAPDCSNTILKGRYKISSKSPAGADAEARYAIDGSLELDGGGGLGGEYRLSRSTGQLEGTLTGSYRLYADCTAHATFDI